MSDGACDVSLGDYDGDPASVFNSHVLKARKPHKCFECSQLISIGAMHERVSGKWDGKWETYRFCLPCSEISREFSDGGRTFGYLWEGMGENWDEGAHLQACLNRLTTVAAKEQLRDQWLQWKGIEDGCSSPPAVDAVDPHAADPGKLATRDKTVAPQDEGEKA